MLFISSLLSISTVTTADENAFGYRIFEIQKKHAIKGSTLAQYKLGTFYEFGISVKPNPEEAKVWYEKAAKKRNKPAADRLIYLELKQRGFRPEDSAWINKIKEEARKGNVHSTIILGQLHHYGIAVRKDLKRAVKLLRKASSRGHTEVDDEVSAIEKQLNKNKPKEKPVKEQQAESVQKKSAEKSSPPKAEPVKKAPPKPKKKKSTKKSATVESTIKEEERRRKYEKAMRKQYHEALILQQQQEWSEGEEWSDESD